MDAAEYEILERLRIEQELPPELRDDLAQTFNYGVLVLNHRCKVFGQNVLVAFKETYERHFGPLT